MLLDDLSLMPFGKYKGIPMQEVPVNYLHWYWNNCKVGDDKCKAVRDYIYRFLTCLKSENPDLIWDRP